LVSRDFTNSALLSNGARLSAVALLAIGGFLGSRSSATPPVGNFPFFLQPYGGGPVNITTQAGVPVVVPLQASDFDLPNDQLLLHWNNVPAGGSVNPPTPYQAPPGIDINATFSWTPTLADVGNTYTAVFTVFDSENHTTKADINITVEGPMAVELADFTASQDDVGSPVVIRWDTASEIDNAFFNIYRSEGFDQEVAPKLNSAPIIATGSPFEAASYARLDRKAELGKVYYYWLEAVDIFGESQIFGPMTVLVR
jgi:hypothetical protein